MVRVSFVYRKDRGTRFDVEFYIHRHMPKVRSALAPHGLTAVEVDVPAGDGTEQPFHAVGHLYFDRVEQFNEGFSLEGPALKANIPNYTDVAPEIQVSVVVPCEEPNNRP